MCNPLAKNYPLSFQAGMRNREARAGKIGKPVSRFCTKPDTMRTVGEHSDARSELGQTA
jgi:hypothetical protein